MPKLKYSEVICPICLSILIEPVTLPCNHEMCLVCYEESIHSSNIACPMCRLRISSWSRRASREKRLVNIDRWNAIKKAFPQKVEKKLAGEDDCEVAFEDSSNPRLSKPGEIRKEYEERLLEFQLQQALKREQDERASEEYIKTILPQADEQNFTVTQPTDNLIPSHSSSSAEGSNSLISIHKNKLAGKRKNRSSSVESGDSIRPELQYFKPIKTAPKTPPKRQADGQLIEAPVMCIKPRKLVYNSMPYETDSFSVNKLDCNLSDVDGKVGMANSLFSPTSYKFTFRQDNQPLHSLSLNSPSMLVDKRARRGFSSSCAVNEVEPVNLNCSDILLVGFTSCSAKEKDSKASFNDHHSENNSESEDINNQKSKLQRHNIEKKTQGNSKVQAENMCLNQQSCSMSKVMQENCGSVKSQMSSFCNSRNTKSSLNRKLKRHSEPTAFVCDTAATNERNTKLINCRSGKLRSSVLLPGDSNFADMTDFKSSTKNQINKDYTIAMKLQKKFDQEVRKLAVPDDIKSNYNLRKRSTTKRSSKK